MTYRNNLEYEMPRKIRSHAGIYDSPAEKTLTPKHLTKQEFGKRLYGLMLAKGWHQSELARQAGIARDAVSVYIRGKALPTPLNRDRLAKALSVDPDELLPNHIESAIDEDMPAFEMKVSSSAPGTAWLRVNRLVRTSTAVRIAELLEADDALNRSGSSHAPAMQQVESEEAEDEPEAELFARPTRTSRRSRS
jgi:transcriptional regulator with XRE-family HTH domain